MRCGARFRCGGDKKELNWLGQRLAGRNVNERAVVEESGVERRESVVAGLGVLREVFLKQTRIVRQRGCEASRFDAVGQRAKRRERFR